VARVAPNFTNIEKRGRGRQMPNWRREEERREMQHLILF
jgi:hypothetical protein